MVVVVVSRPREEVRRIAAAVAEALLGAREAILAEDSPRTEATDSPRPGTLATQARLIAPATSRRAESDTAPTRGLVPMTRATDARTDL